MAWFESGFNLELAEGEDAINKLCSDYGLSIGDNLSDTSQNLREIFKYYGQLSSIINFINKYCSGGYSDVVGHEIKVCRVGSSVSYSLPGSGSGRASTNLITPLKGTWTYPTKGGLNFEGVNCDADWKDYTDKDGNRNPCVYYDVSTNFSNGALIATYITQRAGVWIGTMGYNTSSGDINNANWKKKYAIIIAY